MLLRRYLEHVSTQNWTAVTLDLCVVVLGLFIGLQLDSWNQGRKDIAQEREYLEMLSEDFNINAEILDGMWKRHDRMAKDMMFAVSVIKSGALGSEDHERFKWAVMTMNQVPPLALNMAGYRAMIAAGDFSLIRDKRLRSQLISIAAEIEFDQNAYWRTRVDFIGFPDDLQISRAIPNPSGRGIVFELDFSVILAYQNTLSVIANARRTHSQIAESRSRLRNLFIGANELIANSLQSGQGRKIATMPAGT